MIPKIKTKGDVLITGFAYLISVILGLGLRLAAIGIAVWVAIKVYLFMIKGSP